MSENKHVKLKKNMGLGLLIASVFFLFEPNINLADIIPDLVGYVLLYLGLTQLAVLNDDIADAQNKFKWGMVIGALRPISMIMVNTTFAEKERPTSILLFTFLFSLAEVIFIVSAYKSMFEGITSLWSRRGGDEIYSATGSVTLGEKAERFTTVFLIVKALLAVLPEATALTLDIYTENFIMYLYNYITHFRIIGFIIASVFSIIWLRMVLKFFKALKKETDVIESLTHSFEENAKEHEGVFIKRNIYIGILPLILGAVLCVDLHIPEFNVIPDILAALMFASGAFLLRKYLKSYKKALYCSIAYFVLSGAASIVKIVFLDRHGFFTAANFKDDAYVDFIIMCVSTVIENLAFIFAVFFVILMLRELVRKHAGGETDNSGELTSSGKTHFKKLWAVALMAVIAAVFSTVYDFMLRERGYFADAIWAIDFFVSVFFAVAFTLSTLTVWDDIKTKYLYS